MVLVPMPEDLRCPVLLWISGVHFVLLVCLTLVVIALFSVPGGMPGLPLLIFGDQGRFCRFLDWCFCCIWLVLAGLPSIGILGVPSPCYFVSVM